MSSAKVFADRLHLTRRNMRWDQAKLAEKSGVSRGYISELERGVKKNVGLEVVFALADALGVTVPYLLGLGDNPIGEETDNIVQQQSENIVVFEVDTIGQRQTIKQLIDEYNALTPRSQYQVIQYLRMMRQIEEEERAANPQPRIIGNQ